jgi:hypothetical protein
MGMFQQENIPSIVRTNGTTITLPSTNNGQSTSMQIGGQSYSPASALTMVSSTTGAGGLDVGSLAAIQLWYVYAIVNQTTFAPALVASLAAPSVGPSMPSGYGTAYKLVGAFYTDGTSAIGSVVAGALGGTVSTEWMVYTPAYTSGGSPPTFESNSGNFRRVGDVVQLHFRTRPNATGSGTVNPNQLTNIAIDTAKLVPALSGVGVGLGVVHNNTGTSYVISYATATGLFVIDNYAAGISWGAGGVANGNTIAGSYYYPVTGWKASLL